MVGLDDQDPGGGGGGGGAHGHAKDSDVLPTLLLLKHELDLKFREFLIFSVTRRFFRILNCSSLASFLEYKESSRKGAGLL